MAQKLFKQRLLVQVLYYQIMHFVIFMKLEESISKYTVIT